MKVMDNNNSIVNLSNSILKHFNAPTFHPSIKEIDKKLEGKKKVLVFLFDGMGKAVLEKHFDENSFFRTHIIHEMTSTTPATTVASTTSFLSGKSPIETGWLGWSLYFKDLDRNVDVFPNRDSDTKESLGDERVMEKVCHFENIDEQINKANKKDIARIIMGYPVNKDNKKVRRLGSFVKYAFKETQKTEESFTYAYWVDPDMTMHKEGITTKKVHKCITKIQKLVKKFSSKNKDVAVLVIADHGMIDVTFENMYLKPEITKMFLRNISLEKRTINFFIKDEYKKEFPELFKKYYGEHYDIFPTSYTLEHNFFGEGTPHPMAKSFLGDYIALAKDGFSLECTEEINRKVKFKGHHAGGTLDEMLISVIGINLD